jgi:hypothetical protein
MRAWIYAWRWVRIVFRYFFLLAPKESRLATKVLENVKSLIQKNGNQVFQDAAKFQSSLSSAEVEQEERSAFWELCEHEGDALHQCVAIFVDRSTFPTMNQDPLPFLLILDEARFLINTVGNLPRNFSLFRVLRAALKKKDYVFAVLVDTTSHLSNFSPALRNDPSSRNVEGDFASSSTELFPPFNWLVTTDVLSDKDPYSYGRPLWKTTLDAYESGNKVPESSHIDLVNFAWTKLQCSNSSPMLYTPTVIMAMIAVLTGISVSPISNMATELVGSHMATCCAIESNREAILISYPPEPILAEAALQKLHQCVQDGSTNKILDCLLSSFRIGVLDSGHNGELVVKLFCLIARCGEMFKCLTVGEFFKALLRIDVDNHGELSFTCFTSMIRGDKPFQDFWEEMDPSIMLKKLFDRRVAVELPKNQKGADLLLPVRQKNKNDESFSYKYILIQVKNVEVFPNSKVEIVANNLHPQAAFGQESVWVAYSLPIGLLINVGVESSDTSVKKVLSNIWTAIGVDKFMHLFIATERADVKTRLMRLLRERPVKEWGTEKKIGNLHEIEMILSFNPFWGNEFGKETNCQEAIASDTDGVCSSFGQHKKRKYNDT